MTGLMIYTANRVFLLGALPQQKDLPLPRDPGPDIMRAVCRIIRIVYANINNPGISDLNKSHISLKVDFVEEFKAPDGTFDSAVLDLVPQTETLGVEGGFQLSVVKMALHQKNKPLTGEVFSFQLERGNEEIQLGDVIRAIEDKGLLRYQTKISAPLFWADQDYFSKVVEALSAKGCISRQGKIRNWVPSDPITPVTEDQVTVDTADRVLQYACSEREWFRLGSMDLMKGKPYR